MLHISDLEISFREQTLLKKGELRLDKAELIVLAGKNGAGKSTLLKMICGLLPLQKGSVKLVGTELHIDSPMHELVSFMPSMPPQQCYLRVDELVKTSHVKGNAIFGKRGVDTDTYLRKVGMISFAQRVFNSLSDGEKQKVMIARALAQETPIILLDEPLAFLDYPSKIELLDVLKQVSANEQKLIVYSSHDLELSMKRSDGMILLDGGVLKMLHSEMLKEINPSNLFQ
ncbi:ABC transporter ATP-binding protein [Bacteroidia bacterium]|nr:ABC transporter ATP-binding protein [Bacteroidia bacterium]